MLKVAKKGGPSLVIAQNHAGAAVYYWAHLSENEGDVRAIRTVDFPGRRAVRLTGSGFKASIVHAKRTESRG